MNDDRSLERAARSWLEDGPTQAPDRAVEAAILRIETTSQERDLRVLWRLPKMTTPARVAAAAVIGVLAIGGAIYAFGPGGSSFGGPRSTPSPTSSPTPSPTKSPSPGPSPALFPDGPLAAGSYTIQPFVGAGGLCVGQAGCTEAGAEDDSIRITLTVPEGWAGFEYSIVPSVESYSPPDGAALLFGRGGWVYTVSPVCGGSGPDFPTGPNIPTGLTVDEFVTALVDHPDLDVTSPIEVTLGGYSGKYLELRAPANTTTDELGPKPGECNYYFVWEPGIYAQGPNALWRIWVLDVDGVRVVVRSDSFPGTTQQVQAQLAAIVDSIQIEP
jgi:hypothetical protein